MQKLSPEIRHCAQPFDAVAWVAKKYRQLPATAGLIAELWGISRHNYEALDISPSNIPQNIDGESCAEPPSFAFGGTRT